MRVMYTRMRCQWKSESSELSGWWLWAWSWELGAELRSCKTNLHSWPSLRHNSLPSFPCSMWTGVLPGCRCAWSSLRSQGGIRSPWTDVKASREPLSGSWELTESWKAPSLPHSLSAFSPLSHFVLLLLLCGFDSWVCVWVHAVPYTG